MTIEPLHGLENIIWTFHLVSHLARLDGWVNLASMSHLVSNEPSSDCMAYCHWYEKKLWRIFCQSWCWWNRCNVPISVYWLECRFWIQKVDGSNPSINMFSPWARYFIRIASVDSAVKWVPGGDNLMKDVQCYELFGWIALKNHAFSFFHCDKEVEEGRQVLAYLHH